jgi:hypothetical protein
LSKPSRPQHSDLKLSLLDDVPCLKGVEQGFVDAGTLLFRNIELISELLLLPAGLTAFGLLLIDSVLLGLRVLMGGIELLFGPILATLDYHFLPSQLQNKARQLNKASRLSTKDCTKN